MSTQLENANTPLHPNTASQTEDLASAQVDRGGAGSTGPQANESNTAGGVGKNELAVPVSGKEKAPEWAGSAEEKPIHLSITKRQRHLLLIPICCALFLAALDQMIIIVCLPHIINEFGHPELLAWVISAYLIACSAMTALYGRFSDVFGRRAVFLISLAMFTIGSIVGGASTGVWMLIVARGIQGLGGGGLMTLSMVVIGDIAKPSLRPKYIAAVTMMFGLASVLGPLVGGVFTDEVSWRWVFWINVPLSAIAFVILFMLLKYKVGMKKLPLDLLGAALVFCATVCFVLFISWGGQDNGYPWDSDVIIALICACIALTILFIIQEFRHPLPILNLKLFASLTYTSLVVIMGFGAFSIFGTFSFLPLYFQVVYGDSAIMSGFRLLPQVGGIMALSIMGGRVMSKFGIWRPTLIFSTCALLVGCGLLSMIDPQTTYAHVGGSMVLVGVGLGGIFPLCTVVVQNTVSRSDMANALSGLRFWQNLMGAASVAIVGAVVNSFEAQMMKESGGDRIKSLCYGIHWGFIVTTAVATVPVVVSFTLRALPDPKKNPSGPAPPAAAESAPAVGHALAGHAPPAPAASAPAGIELATISYSEKPIASSQPAEQPVNSTQPSEQPVSAPAQPTEQPVHSAVSPTEKPTDSVPAQEQPVSTPPETSYPSELTYSAPNEQPPVPSEEEHKA